MSGKQAQLAIWAIADFNLSQFKYQIKRSHLLRLSVAFGSQNREFLYRHLTDLLIQLRKS
ncbi:MULTISPECIES: hypothetical protein [Calothrix]|uniref:Transposase n=2 Tax=Calothrix TaxID=1186 RepID=A0ABR8ACK0_9CYAN|nr:MULTISPECIES: hypothetical protein [Calothrix]MBD2197736.1 hypothetical protein [Calothrix parietina FACHB-288]MBD2225665.1 hypothetical protein [Calothrix anomala FACHB-343]